MAAGLAATLHDKRMDARIRGNWAEGNAQARWIVEEPAGSSRALVTEPRMAETGVAGATEVETVLATDRFQVIADRGIQAHSEDRRTKAERKHRVRGALPAVVVVAAGDREAADAEGNHS